MASNALMIQKLEEALATGELRVRWGDRYIEYRTVNELIQAITYLKEQDKAEAAAGGATRPRQVRTNGYSAWTSRR